MDTNVISTKIEIDTTQIDIAIFKVEKLIHKLKEANSLINEKASNDE